ncbi:MAG: thiamine phosphate synthase [Myxococcota bacterium]
MTLPFRLVVITDWRLPDLPARVARALEAGPGIAVQHRHPGATDRQFFDEATALAPLCAKANAPLFVNRRLDVALAVGAHLHLPATGLRVADVRPFLPGKWISVAVHDEAEARDAAGADLALVSPVFPPGSKPEDTRPTLGADGLIRLAQGLPPTFALGGIDAARLRTLGPIAGAAVISAVLAAEDPRDSAAQLLATLTPRPDSEAERLAES